MADEIHTRDEIMSGYWPSPWPAEDGGPLRRAVVPARSIPVGRVSVTSRHEALGCMVVLRERGQVFYQGNGMNAEGAFAWVERIHPDSLERIVRSPDLAGGPFWPGGIAAHRNGSLYVTFGRHCHRLDPDTLAPVASRELPRARPYNSLLVLPDGALVMKDFGGGRGARMLPTGEGSELVVLEPDRLEVIAQLELPEGSIARISASVPADHGETGRTRIHVVGDEHLLEVVWDPKRGSLSLDARIHYLTRAGQTFGWDPVIADGSIWLLDDGEGTDAFGPSFRGKGVSTAPLQLLRIPLEGDRTPAAVEVCGKSDGIIANPPCIDARRKVAIGYDSGNGILAAWRYGSPREELAPLWQRDQHHASHFLLDESAGTVLTGDFDHERGVAQAVVLDVESGAEILRVDTASPLQSVIFPSPGWDGEVYVTSFTTLARIAPA
jgi:hypothetical protein